MVVFISMILVTISIKVAKRQSHHLIENQDQAITRNNQSAYNGDVIENIILVIICAFGILSAVLQTLGTYVDTFENTIIKTISIFFSAYFHVIFSMTVLPVISVGANPKIKKFIIEEARELRP